VQTALMNIRFEGNNGHDAEATWADSASSSAITSSAHGYLPAYLLRRGKYLRRGYRNAGGQRSGQAISLLFNVDGETVSFREDLGSPSARRLDDT
jgi:hypothetical protein